MPMQEVEHEGLVVCCHLGVGNPDEQVEGASGGLALEAIDRLDSAQAVVHPLPDSAAMAIEPARVVRQPGQKTVLGWGRGAQPATEKAFDSVAHGDKDPARVVPGHVAYPPTGCEVDLGDPVKGDNGCATGARGHRAHPASEVEAVVDFVSDNRASGPIARNLNQRVDLF